MPMAVTFKLKKTRYHFTDNFIISFENLIGRLKVLSYFDNLLPGIWFRNEYQTMNDLGLAKSSVISFYPRILIDKYCWIAAIWVINHLRIDTNSVLLA